MRTIALAAAAVATIGSANAFDVAPKFTPGENGDSLECSIVSHRPDRDSDPAYKISIQLRAENGRFQGLDVSYTLRSGRVVDRTQQYPNGTTWTKMPRTTDWYWSGTIDRSINTGHLYHNDSDGWMYTETIQSPRGTYHMLADCHSVAG